MWQHPLESPESSKMAAGKGAESSNVVLLNSGAGEDRQEETPVGREPWGAQELGCWEGRKKTQERVALHPTPP